MPRPLLPPNRVPFARTSGLRRRPALYWSVALGVALLTGLTVARLTTTAAAEAARFGDLRSVPVATTELSVGHVVQAGDVELRSMPAAFVPSGPLAGEPIGSVVAVPMVAGDVVLAGRLAPQGLGPVAGRLPPGHVGLAVPVDPAGLRLSLGDRVDLLATFALELATDGADPTFPVAEQAVVVDVAEQAVTVAVRRHDAPRVAFALTHGAVTVALTGLPAPAISAGR